MKKKTVFISGIAGLLGSHLADMLVAEGYRVVGCDNLVGGKSEYVPREADLFVYDVCDFQKNERHTRGVDVIFHAAAIAYDGLSFFAPAQVGHNIFSGTLALASAAARNHVRRFIYCSSMARYGNQPGPFTENMMKAPVTPYAIAKAAAEDVLLSICKVTAMEPVICVPHNIVGPRQKYDDPYRNVAAIMTNRMLQGLQPVIYGDGEQLRCFSSIWDTLQVFEQMITSPIVVGEILNVGPDEEFISINQLAHLIASLIPFELQPQYLPARPFEVQEALCSSAKIRQMLGYRTRYNARETLQELVRWIRSQGPKPFLPSLELEYQTPKTPNPWAETVQPYWLKTTSAGLHPTA